MILKYATSDRVIAISPPTTSRAIPVVLITKKRKMKRGRKRARKRARKGKS